MDALRIASALLLAATAVGERNDAMHLMQYTAESNLAAEDDDDRCRLWCIGDAKKTWEQKCGYRACRGCAACNLQKVVSTPLQPGILTTPSSTGTMQLYDTIIEEVGSLIQSLPDTCDYQECPRGELAGCILRIAGADIQDYKDGRGGMDGCVNPADVGLWECLHYGTHGVRLASVWDKHNGELSFADFLVISAEAVMTNRRGDLQPPFPFRSHFRFGRTTTEDCSWSYKAALAQPWEGCNGVRRVFMGQLGLSVRGSSALMGVHTIGRARSEYSGWNGYWSAPEQSSRFNNNYYLSLLLKGWAPGRSPNGRNQWNHVGSGTERGKPQMMLDSDMCLAYGDEVSDSSVQDCCAWIMPDAFDAINASIPDGGNKAVDRLNEQTQNGRQWCGTTFPNEIDDVKQESFEHIRDWCCVSGTRGPDVDCGNPRALKGMAAAHILEFANDEAAWIAEFQKSWTHVTEIGSEHQLFTPA